MIPVICCRTARTIPMSRTISHARLEELPQRAGLVGERVLDLRQFRPRVRRRRPRGSESPGPRPSRPCFVSQRGLSGTTNDRTSSTRAGSASGAEHPSPADSLVPRRVALQRDEVVHEVHDEKARDDGELVDGDHAPADAGRLISAMYMGEVMEAAPTPRPPRMRKRMNMVDRLRHGRPDGGDEEQDRREDQDLLSAEPVADRPRRRRRRGHSPAGHSPWPSLPAAALRPKWAFSGPMAPLMTPVS